MIDPNLLRSFPLAQAGAHALYRDAGLPLIDLDRCLRYRAFLLLVNEKYHQRELLLSECITLLIPLKIRDRSDET